jgi:hypothetical protein
MSYYETDVILGYTSNVPLTKSILSSNDVVHPTGEQCRIVSTSAEDSAAGTGIQKVIIVYFTPTWEYKQEIVELNGTTPVDTVNVDIYRIQHFSAIKTGSNDFAVGTITLKNLTETNLFAQIDTEKTSFKRALHYVRRGFRCQLKSMIICCSTSVGVEFNFYIKTDYESIGGNFVCHSFIPVKIKDNVVMFAGESLPLIDAVESSRPVAIYACAKGLAPDQYASIYLLIEEFHVKDV